jgi:transposase
MWPAYLNSVSNNSPDSIIVYDKFHIVKKMNEALSQTRKDLFKQETLVDNKKLLKGMRWLLLNKSENLSEKGKQRLEKAFEITWKTWKNITE